MKRKISLIICGVILLAVGICGYKFFFDCNKYYSDFEKMFTLEKMDYAVVGDEYRVKLVKIEDNRCFGDKCGSAGEYEYKLFVANGRHISYVTVSSVDKKEVKIEKLKCTLKFEDEEEGKKITFSLAKDKEKK